MTAEAVLANIKTQWNGFLVGNGEEGVEDGIPWCMRFGTALPLAHDFCVAGYALLKAVCGRNLARLSTGKPDQAR